MAYDNLNQLIKKLAMDAVRASKPCDIIIGTVEQGNPMKIKLSEKVTLDSDYFYVTKTAKECNLEKGNKVALIRANGGQKYLVVDKVV